LQQTYQVRHVWPVPPERMEQAAAILSKCNDIMLLMRKHIARI